MAEPETETDHNDQRRRSLLWKLHTCTNRSRALLPLASSPQRNSVRATGVDVPELRDILSQTDLALHNMENIVVIVNSDKLEPSTTGLPGTWDSHPPPFFPSEDNPIPWMRMVDFDVDRFPESSAKSITPHAHSHRLYPPYWLVGSTRVHPLALNCDYDILTPIQSLNVRILESLPYHFPTPTFTGKILIWMHNIRLAVTRAEVQYKEVLRTFGQSDKTGVR
ncbi:hypothetical protein GX48_03086 [Paracoccidioides brasiliensis]|nr:hypothetical protein GX48_03086 [Paracoccidioides brasiliensis]